MIHIIRATWQEIWRKRVLLMTLLLSVVAMGLFLVFVHIQISNNYDGGGLVSQYISGTAAVCAGLYLVNFIVAYLSIFSAAGTISSEAESGLLLAILPRPLGRWQVYLGKWIGYATWSLAYGALMFWAVLLIVHFQLHYPMHWLEIFSALGLFELVPLVLVTVTAFGSLFLSTLSNGIAMTLLYSIGVIGGFLGRLGSVMNPPTPTENNIVFFTGLFMPADAAYHRMVYELTGGSNGLHGLASLGPFGASDIVPSRVFIVYIGVYVIGLLAFGMMRFGRRDM